MKTEKPINEQVLRNVSKNNMYLRINMMEIIRKQLRTYVCQNKGFNPKRKSKKRNF